ncbi:hypothetical protein AVEN_154229-1 [Araneus ventricosus]|uniref:Uncharacterized protein n=1 Tax=Araneus ventricosus TaxID=182803 RepID=A0A4Y2GSG1_ARAVE|nr:hypothetical protein AVEN_154229-1 [Araneus ventricosus]
MSITTPDRCFYTFQSSLQTPTPAGGLLTLDGMNIARAVRTADLPCTIRSRTRTLPAPKPRLCQEAIVASVNELFCGKLIIHYCSGSQPMGHGLLLGLG